MHFCNISIFPRCPETWHGRGATPSSSAVLAVAANSRCARREFPPSRKLFSPPTPPKKLRLRTFPAAAGWASSESCPLTCSPVSLKNSPRNKMTHCLRKLLLSCTRRWIHQMTAGDLKWRARPAHPYNASALLRRIWHANKRGPVLQLAAAAAILERINLTLISIPSATVFSYEHLHTAWKPPLLCLEKQARPTNRIQTHNVGLAARKKTSGHNSLTSVSNTSERFISICECCDNNVWTNCIAETKDISGRHSFRINESFIYNVKVHSVNKYILCTYLQRKKAYFTAIR